MSGSTRPRVVLLRGHEANVWDLRPWERLTGDFDVEVLVTGSNLHQVEGLGLTVTPVRSPRDVLPGGRAAGAIAYALGERYLGLEDHLRGAGIVHAAEIGRWFGAQAAGLRDRLGFKLALTVWETIAWRDAYRWPRERAYRRATLPAADLLLPATERARDGLLLEGADPARIEVCPPGIDLDRFSPTGPEPAPVRHRILSAGRLVWEKGHQDVLRAFAHLDREDAELEIVGSGPEEKRLRAYAADLGVADRTTFRPTVPYEEMPALYRSASALVLASLPTKAWEEQFGMVLVEAMACGTPVVACATGAIPEVVGGDGALVSPGDWRGLAEALAAGPLARAPGGRARVPGERLARYSTGAAAARYRAVYERLLRA